MNRHTETGQPGPDTVSEYKPLANAAAVKELFGELMDAADAGDQSRRDQLIAAAPPAVRDAALALLDAHHNATGMLLEETIPGPSAGTGAPTHTDFAPAIPPQIDGYEIGDELGRGGFGIVYAAQQFTPVRRPVAIKVLRAEFATPETAARFRAEAGVLAHMNHEGIARILDAGLDRLGRAFVAMELIHGEPITQYAQQHNLSVRHRVELMAQVCDAVHHAHQRAVLHRDLKPANILVEETDGGPRPRVIDFGIARRMEGEPGDRLTREGVRPGTPRYMSPEQQAGDDRADTRSDVYALGVLLCEVLTGRGPHDGDGGQDRNGNPRTATRPSVLAEQAGEPAALRAREISGDLDRVVLKAVSVDPELRYGSAMALGLDLRRYLGGRAVEAVAPSPVYLLRKFIGRHRTLTLAAAVTLLSLAVGGLAFVRGAQQARTGRIVAEKALAVSERERARGDAVASFLLGDLLSSMNPDLAGGRETTVLDMLRRASAEAPTRLGAEPAVLAGVLARVGAAQQTLSDYAGAADSLSGAVEAATASGSMSPGELIDLRIDALLNTMSARRFGGIEAIMEDILADAQGQLPPEHPTLLRAQLHAGHILEDDAGKAIARTGEALGRIEQLGLTETDLHLEALRYSGSVLSIYGDRRAVEILEKANDLSQRLHGPTHSRSFEIRMYLAHEYFNAGLTEQAQSLYTELEQAATEIYGIGNTYTMIARGRRAHLAMLRGEDAREPAAGMLESVLAMGLEGKMQHAYALQLLGTAHTRAGEDESAVNDLIDAISIRRQLGIADMSEQHEARVLLAEAWLRLGEVDKVLAAVDDLVDILEPMDAMLPRAASVTADALMQAGEPASARQVLSRTIEHMPSDAPERENLMERLRSLNHP